MTIGQKIYEVFGDGFIERITMNEGVIIAEKSGYFMASFDGIESAVFEDEGHDNMDFEEFIGTDYRTFTRLEDAKKYLNYLKRKGA